MTTYEITLSGGATMQVVSDHCDVNQIGTLLFTNSNLEGKRTQRLVHAFANGDWTIVKELNI